MKKIVNSKKGISLITLVITLTSTYDEADKIDRHPPKNKIINENKVYPKCWKKGLTFWVYFLE